MDSYQHYKTIENGDGVSHLFRINFDKEQVEWMCLKKNQTPFIFLHNSVQLVIRMGMQYMLEEISSKSYHDLLAKVLSKKCEVKYLNIDGLQRDKKN